MSTMVFIYCQRLGLSPFAFVLVSGPIISAKKVQNIEIWSVPGKSRCRMSIPRFHRSFLKSVGSSFHSSAGIVLSWIFGSFCSFENLFLVL